MNEKQRARINFMKERVVNTIPEMDLENARILTESFRETGGEPLSIQKALIQMRARKRWGAKNICYGMVRKEERVSTVWASSVKNVPLSVRQNGCLPHPRLMAKRWIVL